MTPNRFISDLYQDKGVRCKAADTATGQGSIPQGARGRVFTPSQDQSRQTESNGEDDYQPAQGLGQGDEQFLFMKLGEGGLDDGHPRAEGNGSRFGL